MAAIGDYNYNLYKCLLDAPVGIILSKKSDDKIIEANGEASRILHTSNDVLKNKSIKHIFYLPEQTCNESYAQFAARTHMVELAQLINARIQPDGSLAIAALTKEISGTEPILCTVFWDAQKDSSNGLINHSPSFMGTLSLKGEVLFASPSSKALFGVTPEDMHGHNMIQFIHAESQSLFSQCLAKIEAGDGICSGVMRVVNKTGIELLVPITLISELDSQNKPTKIFVTAYDNTQVRQQRSMEVAKIRDSSKENVQRVTAKVDTVNESCRLLLEKILYIESKALSPKSKRTVDEAKSLIGQISRQMHDIHQSSKILQKHIHVHHVLFDLRKSIDCTFESLKAKIQTKNLKITLEIQQSIAQFMYADEARIREVITYFLSNSVEFTPNNGNIALRVFTIEETPTTATLTFEIEDSGLSVPAEAQVHLFKSHLQVDPTSQRTSCEAGKNLNLCRAIISILQGTMGMHSTQQNGIKFYFSLRMQKGDLFESPAPMMPESSIGIFKQLQLKVLIVDDLTLNRKICTQILHNLGASLIMEAENGKHAVEQYIDSEIDLILMDIQMPVMDGFDAVRSIRDLELYNKRHVTILFASGTDITEDAAKDAGAEARVSKPYKIDEFIACISRYVKKAPGA